MTIEEFRPHVSAAIPPTITENNPSDQAAPLRLFAPSRAEEVRSAISAILTSPVKPKSAEAKFRLHTCFHVELNEKPKFCQCKRFLTQEQRDLLVALKAASHIDYLRIRNGKEIVNTLKFELVLHISMEEYGGLDRKISSDGRHFRLQESRRTRNFKKKLPALAEEFRRLAAEVGVEMSATDDEIISALGDNLLAGLVPPEKLSSFNPLMQKFSDLRLASEGLTEYAGREMKIGDVVHVFGATGRGDKPVGAKDRFVTGGFDGRAIDGMTPEDEREDDEPEDD